MTVLDGRSSALVGEWPFEYRIDDLKQVGVNLAQEQISLYNRVGNHKGGWYSNDVLQDEHLWAMTIEVIPDPEQDMLNTKPMEVWSVDRWGDLQQPELLVVPRLVRLDWNLWPDLDVLEPGWRRFPSLPGRAIDEDGDLGTPEGYRLWNLWPLDHQGQLDVHDAYQDARNSTWLSGFDQYLAFYEGASSACEAAHCERHQHVDDPLGLYGCKEAEEWVHDMRLTYVFIDDDGMEHWKAPPERWYQPVQWPTSEAWHQLLGYSAQNAWASLSACPDPDAVREDEKRYSPWLWSS